MFPNGYTRNTITRIIKKCFPMAHLGSEFLPGPAHFLGALRLPGAFLAALKEHLDQLLGQQWILLSCGRKQRESCCHLLLCIYIIYIYILTYHIIPYHYITLHYITLHCIALHYITLLTYIHTYVYMYHTCSQLSLYLYSIHPPCRTMVIVCDNGGFVPLLGDLIQGRLLLFQDPLPIQLQHLETLRFQQTVGTDQTPEETQDILSTQLGFQLGIHLFHQLTQLISICQHANHKSQVGVSMSFKAVAGHVIQQS